MRSDNFSRLVKIIALLLCTGGILFGFNLVVRYFRLQQLQEASRLLAQKEYSAAVTAYDELLQTDVARPHILWINRGYALAGLNRYDDMLQSCMMATKVHPQAAMAWNCRGEALYHLGRDETAVESFERAIALYPQNAAFWLNQAQVLFRLQRYNVALAANEQAIELLAKSRLKNLFARRLRAIAYEQQGQSLLATNRPEQALAAFEQSLKYAPNYLAAQQKKGIALYRLNRHGLAIEVFEQILQRKDLTPEQQAINLLYKGLSLCQTQKKSAADRAFSQVLQLTTNDKVEAIAKAGCGIR